MKITRGYKTELDPTAKQHSLLCQCAGTARFSYNYGLARKQEVYQESGKTISAIDLQKELTARKHADLPLTIFSAAFEKRKLAKSTRILVFRSSKAKARDVAPFV